MSQYHTGKRIEKVVIEKASGGKPSKLEDREIPVVVL